ncbi:MAG: polysaccharide biosynthesis/export family protein [Fibrobacter sp.]|nr:polysaccharide biosynthesis/export family protein [Fibrobacter sp.]
MLRLIATILLLAISAFAEGNVYLNSALNGTSTITPRSTVTLSPSYAENPVDSTYQLGPGDFLDIGLENNYLTVQIYPDGSVAIEECGSVNVLGKTLAEAREMILDLVSKRYKREFCYVQLASLKRFRVSVMGAVSQVGQHMVEPQTRLSYFVRQIGGTIPNANTEDLLIIRKGDTLHVNFNEIAARGDFASDIMLQQGDQIYVPFVPTGDNVTLIFPGYRTSVAYKDGRTLQDYYELSGSSRLHNYGYKALCVREPDKAPYWIPLSEMKNTVVAPNTEVEFTVAQMFVYVGGAVGRIGQFDYTPSWHAIDYIAAAGLNTISGSWSQVKVWRGKNPEAMSLSITEDQILPGDYIEVPKSRYESFKDFTLFLASLLTVVSSAFIIYVNYK